jgi:tetratricopeptide (TPR) repeat protein
MRLLVRFLGYAGPLAFLAVAQPHQSWPVAVTAIAVLGVIFLVAARAPAKTRGRFAVDSDGQAAMLRGDFATAEQLYDGLAIGTAAHERGIAALARHNVAWAAMRQGKLERAIEVWVETDECYEAELTATLYFAVAATDRAFALALAGRIDEADRALAEAERRAKKHPPRPTDAAAVVLARATIDCRAGRYEAAAKLIDEHWAACEYALTGSQTRLLRVVRAFALACSDPRNAGVADVVVAQSRPPLFDGEYAFLGAAWPEMAAFLAAHGLA